MAAKHVGADGPWVSRSEACPLVREDGTGMRLRSRRTSMSNAADRLRPTGFCMCGCGDVTKPSKFFVASHDSRAVWAALKDIYGNRDTSAVFISEHGYAPGGPRAERLPPFALGGPTLRGMHKWRPIRMTILAMFVGRMIIPRGSFFIGTQESFRSTSRNVHTSTSWALITG